MVLVWNRGSSHVSLTGLELAGLQFVGIPILLLLGEGYFTPLLGGEGKSFGYFPWRSVQDLHSCVMIKHRFCIWVVAWYREGGVCVWSWGSGVKADPEAFPDGSRGLRAVTDGGEKLGDHYTTFLFVRSGWESRQGKPGLSWPCLTSTVRCAFVFMQPFSAPPFPSHFCFIQMYFVNVLILGCPLRFGKAFCLGSVHWVHLTPLRVHQKFLEQNEACTRIKLSSIPFVSQL